MTPPHSFLMVNSTIKYAAWKRMIQDQCEFIKSGYRRGLYKYSRTCRLAVEAQEGCLTWGKGVNLCLPHTSTPRPRKPRMNVHKNAHLTPQGRALLVRRVRHEGGLAEERRRCCRSLSPTNVLLAGEASGGRRSCPSGPQFGARPMPAPHYRHHRAITSKVHEWTSKCPPT